MAGWEEALRSASWRAKSTPPMERLETTSQYRWFLPKTKGFGVTYGVMGMALRIREPKADGVEPSRLGVAPSVGLLSPELDCRAGVSRTSFRNCELFIVD